MKIFVAGGTGCVGICLIKRLCQLSHEIVALVRPTSNLNPLNEFRKKIEFVKGNILDKVLLNASLEGIDMVFHAAAELHPKKISDRVKERTYYVNVEGTRNLLEASLKNQIRQFIYFSSIGAMGDFYDNIRDEKSVCIPRSHYGKSKLLAEKLVMEYHKKKNMFVTILRPGLIYGPYDRGTVLKMIRYIDKGKFIMIGKGENINNLVSVNNVVEAAISVMGDSSCNGEIFIVTDGKDYSLNEITGRIAKELNVRLRGLYVPLPFAYLIGISCDILRSILKIDTPFTLQNIKNFTHDAKYRIDKILIKTNFKPIISFHNGGIQEEINWYKENFKNQNA